jgi:hypothetical protein
MWTTVRRLTTILPLAAAALTLFAPGSGSWFFTALGIYCCGIVVRRLAFDPRLAGGRKVAGFSMVRGYGIMCGIYIIAGGCTLIGAFTSLPAAFAWILTPFILTWTSMWVWLLRKSRGAEWQHHS